jgi:hypothetical protein
VAPEQRPLLVAVRGRRDRLVAAQPTRLRLEERTADGVYTDGRRFAIIESGRKLSILDTFTRTRRTLAGTGCHVGGIQFGQTLRRASEPGVLSCPPAGSLAVSHG